MVVLPLDVEQLVGISLRKSRADEDQQIAFEFLAGNAELVRHVLDMESLVVHEERHQLEHARQLVFGGAFAGALSGARVGECVGRQGCRKERGGACQATLHCGGELFGCHDLGVGAVGGQFLTQQFSVTVGNRQPVPPAVGRSFWRADGGGPLPQPQQAVFADIHDGGLERQFREAIKFGADVEAGRRRKGLLRQHRHRRGESREPEVPLRATDPVKAHEVPLAEPAAEPPGLDHPLFLPAGAAGEVAEPDGVLGVHRGNQVLERLACGLDAGLHAGRQLDVCQATRRLELAHGIRGGRAEGCLLPELGGQQKNRPFVGREFHVRQPVRLLADAVPRGGGIVRAPAVVRDRFDVEPEVPQVVLVPLEHPAKGCVGGRSDVVDRLPQLAAAQPVLGVQEGDQEVQQAFSTYGGHSR
ncbi:hypothetical protein SRABI83_04223 [Arthrobacter sp. Bi83]|nr:hypothetical protein SRABI83_04223 [Arthrobacter sp. Bi83]